jgi:hypothetical protein
MCPVIDMTTPEEIDFKGVILEVLGISMGRYSITLGGE